VPKHVAVHTCYDLKFIMSICQLMYYCKNMHDESNNNNKKSKIHDMKV